MAIYEETVLSYVAFIETDTTNQYPSVITDQLDFVESLNQPVFYFTDTLVFAEKLSFSGSIRKTVISNLELVDTSRRAHIEYILQVLNLEDGVLKHQYRTDNISFTETITYNRTVVLFDSLEIVDAIAVNGTTSLSVFSILTLNSFNNHLLINARPQDVINIIPLTVTHHSTISLTGNGQTLILPSPDFNDSRLLNTGQLKTETRGRELILERKLNSYNLRGYSYTISRLKESQVSRLLKFFFDTLGKPLILIDYEGITKVVLITTAEPIITQQARFLYTVTFEMEEIDASN